ncbi:uncharacterized protein LOC110840919 [Zootermopsis nevadensis]|uniref:uncharacterized protein LOC110840919 n=1 Tax=Zootermopsis nevadensis TaxID=136037 RepID=UPI000B8E9914|nr:uncharacterized protein LOC110840919 [Zootermopsis nevadensis]
MFLEIYHYVEDLDHIMDAAMLFIIFSGASCLQLYLRFRMNVVMKMLRLTDAFVWEDLPTKDPDTGSLALVAWIPRIQTATTIVTSSAVIFHIIQSTVRFTSDDRPLFYVTWYPFDTNKSPVYELINTVQFVATVTWASFFYGVPPFYGTSICIACSQLEKLRASLKNIRQKNDAPEKDSRAKTDQDEEREAQTSQQVFQHMQKQLNDCVRHHQLIIEYIRAIEDTFNPLLAGYFLILMGGLCFTSYTAVTADRVRDAAWDCDWVGSPITFQRCLYFIINIANKEFILTAGKFVPVSKATMMNMIQQSVSLFMFMLQIKDEEEALEGRR